MVDWFCGRVVASTPVLLRYLYALPHARLPHIVFCSYFHALCMLSVARRLLPPHIFYICTLPCTRAPLPAHAPGTALYLLLRLPLLGVLCSCSGMLFYCLCMIMGRTPFSGCGVVLTSCGVGRYWRSDICVGVLGIATATTSPQLPRLPHYPAFTTTWPPLPAYTSPCAAPLGPDGWT